MRLQMSVHHPNGVHLEKDGAWCTNTSHWKVPVHNVAGIYSFTLYTTMRSLNISSEM